MGRLLDIAHELGQLVEEKSEAYGDSVSSSAEAFRLLYPNGIPPGQYLDALLVVRVWDKLMRIATRKDAFGENPWKDIAGYAIRGAAANTKPENPLVLGPAEKCGDCDGEGRVAIGFDSPEWRACVACGGAGWVAK